MLEEKRLKEIERRVQEYMKNGVIRTKGSKEHTNFFLKNAENAVNTAKAIFDLSTNKEFQEYTGNESLDGSLWVINTSYYSMFYMARALLESEGIKIKSDLSVHAITFDVLVYYFYLTKKLEKKFFEAFVEAQEEAAELLGKEKADRLVEEYFWEKRKRGIFTYEVGEIAMKKKAQTSLERAKNFNQEIRAIIQE